MKRREFIKLGLAAAGASIFPIYGRAQAREIRIGQQADITGVLAQIGYWNQKAAKAAVDKINAEGGIAGKKIAYFAEDTGAVAQKGLTKFRKLVEENQVDFVIGTIHGGTALATLPAAEELKTPIFFTAETQDIIENANRYIFRSRTDARAHWWASAEWAVKNLGKRWSYIVADYAWGRGHEKECRQRVDHFGGESLSSIFVPLGTKDFVPYLTKVDPKTEVLFNCFFGAENVGFTQQSYKLIPKSVIRFGAAGFEGVEVEPLREEIDGAYFVVSLPRDFNEVPGDIRPYIKTLNEAVGVGPDGREITNPKNLVTPNYYWSPWEQVYLIKRGIEKSAWKTREDHPKFIMALEGIKVKAGPAFPQGDMWIRAEDHQGFHDQWIGRFKDGKFRLVVKFPVDKSAYPATVHVNKKSF